jgi:hypothetical protein
MHAQITYGQIAGDPHEITILDDDGVIGRNIVTDREWADAYGTTPAEKIDSILGWTNTEHDRDITFLVQAD